MSRPHDETTDPGLRSFVPVSEGSDFPIQNLPYGVFSADDGRVSIGTRIGDFVLNLSLLEQQGLLSAGAAVRDAFAQTSLNRFMSLGRPVWRDVRLQISHLLRAESSTLRDKPHLREATLVPVGRCRMHLPARIGDYTDFYSSREHATNVGTMFRGKENALMPNWLWIPIGYHGRASSIIVSGTPVRRPAGQVKGANDAAPLFGPTRELDFELELAFFVGPGNSLGQPIPIEEAEDHVFGLTLVNDWSARDMQRWEYVPLGPFLAKSFATTISPWVVTLDALAPYRCAGPAQDPPPLDYLRAPAKNSACDIALEVHLQPSGSSSPTRISRTNFRFMYWSMMQQLAHHTSNGCNLQPGDLLASGTISGPTADSYGSLLELAWKGERPVQLVDGTSRTFVLDGDEIAMTGRCGTGPASIGFGECSGRIAAAVD